VWDRPEPEARGYTVPGLVPEGSVTSLYGDGGSCKAYVVGYLCTCIAAGRKWLDRAVRQGSVLYLNAELDADEFLRRAYAIARGMGLEKVPKEGR
jgi:RecA-family ATPase